MSHALMGTKKLSIVFLDAATVDFGDIDLAPITKNGRTLPFENSSQDEIVKRAGSAEVVIANKCIFDAVILKKLPHLRLICIAATGVNNVDLDLARKRKIAVTNVPGYSTTTVAEHTLLFLLALSHRLFEHHNAAMSGLWSQSPHFAYLDHPFSDLQGKSLGILGYGTIGKKVARLARLFDMKVLVAKLPGRSYLKKEKRLPLKQVLQKSDFITLHCTLTDSTRHLINREKVLWMKPTACLLNLARGPVVQDEALTWALQKNRIAGYATDVMVHEPPPENHPFFHPSLKNKILFTPHIAWASRESRQRLINEIGKNIQAFLEGRKKNRVV
ncbi:MAG: D-2-hydroxyacid dehydrogenase [Deltaproteobacteria bacterium]|nr:D-2-hydroxyacid dehydrogenase [Deltaproteobacteria bacterium]